MRVCGKGRMVPPCVHVNKTLIYKQKTILEIEELFACIDEWVFSVDIQLTYRC